MKLNNTIFLIFCISCLICCKNYNKLKKDVELLQSKTINLPVYSEEIINKRDIELGYGKLKYIVYVDSIACSPCFIEHINLWMKYIYDMQKYNNKIDYYFILSPKSLKRETFIQNITASSFDYPVIFDNNNKFIKLNLHIPKNPQLHTFLLDENNKVILVGNPLINKKIEELFYKIADKELR